MLDPKILRLVAITDDAEDHRPTLVDRVAAAVGGGAAPAPRPRNTATPRAGVEIKKTINRRGAAPPIVNDPADTTLAAGAARVRGGGGKLAAAPRRRFAFFFGGECALRIALSILASTGWLRNRSTRSGSNCVPFPSAIALTATLKLRAWL